MTLIDITDRKLAEEELKKNEEFYRSVLHTTLEGFWVVDLNGSFIDVNEAYCEIIGYSRDELLSMSIEDLEFEQNREVILRQIEEIKKIGKRRFESRHRCKNGELVNLDISVNYLPHNNRLFTFLRDITKQKNAEKIMQARLRISDHAFDRSLDELMTKILDEAEVLTASSIGFFHFVEIDQETLSLQTWSTNTLASICRAKGKRQHYKLENAGVWADCVREREALIHNDYPSMPGRKGLPPGHAPVKRELVVPVLRNNRIVAVVGVGNKEFDYTNQDLMILKEFSNLAWDIVIRKRSEESLRSTQLRYSELFKSLTDAYVNVDMDGRIIESNLAFQTMTGYTEEELYSITYLDLTPEKWHLHESQILEKQVLKRGYSDSYQKEYQRKDGSLISVELKTYLLKDNYETPVGMWAIVGDITERKRAEVELKKAKESAESANRAKSDFLSTMSHEIRTPLSAMLGNLELLEGSHVSLQQMEYLKDCKSASQMLLQVINDVLDFSKIEAGKLELFNEIFSISSLSMQMVRLFTASARQKGLEITLELGKGLPEFIEGDQQRIRQIISNLINNAIKFTKHGRLSMSVECDTENTVPIQGKLPLRIVVSDTGVGIPEDKQELIFESFTQGEAFGKRTASGTGLGLPICRKLLGLMGGSISLSSIPGEGSVFTVLLPVSLCSSTVKVQPVVSDAAKTTPSSIRILLADDDERGRGVAQKLLQRRGYIVEAVENGTKLLETLERESFDILITDISMPDMEGTEVARIIRSGKREGINSKIPIIAMTAHAFAEDRERFLDAGINGYIAKPVNLDLLFSKIEELCSSAD
ncbi:MAG: PAS domain S-box protein [Desulfuromonadaceae bacterium]|nr:PAS domain S-box protein [Desulfuromonadaceae bacterium]MDD2856706.1 PAS domain S-box protein [Desulfuromonadaceae bacterium]